MTASFSSMLIACASIFTPDADQLEQAARFTEKLIAEQAAAIRELAQRDSPGWWCWAPAACWARPAKPR